MTRLLRGAILLALLATAAASSRAATFTVDSAGDGPAGPCVPGGCTLRNAILAANEAAGPDTIAFNIPGGGVQTIRPTSPLPFLNTPMVVDATTQPGYSGTPLIELSGVNAGTVSVDGFRVFGAGPTSGPITIKGLIINRFSGDGVSLVSGIGHTVQGCWIGVDATGNAAAPNFIGVELFLITFTLNSIAAWWMKRWVLRLGGRA